MGRTVTLTDDTGKALGTADILDAHTGTGKLHLAFSVYVFNPAKNSMLIQQRSAEKMLWPTIWANTCCSHPYENETASQAGERRLKEELGIDVKLRAGASFVYRAQDATRGVEHEYVTTLIGAFDEQATVTPNPKEVMAWKWVPIRALLADMGMQPQAYAPWFHLGLPLVLAA